MDWNVRRWTACEEWDGSQDRKAFILTSSILYEVSLFETVQISSYHTLPYDFNRFARADNIEHCA